MFWLPPQEMAKLNVLEEQDLTSEIFALCHRKKLVRVAAYEVLRATFSAVAEITGKELAAFGVPSDWTVRPIQDGERAECLLETHQDSMPGAPKQPPFRLPWHPTPRPSLPP